MTTGGVAGDEGDRLGGAAMGQGRAGRSAGGQGGGDAGNDLRLDTGRAAGSELLAATAEDEGIAALETDDGQALLGEADQQLVDIVLRQGVARLALGHIDQASVGRSQIENFAGDEAVMDDDVGGSDDAGGLDGQQVGIARAGPDQPDHAGLRGAAIQRHKALLGGCGTDKPGHGAIASL